MICFLFGVSLSVQEPGLPVPGTPGGVTGSPSPSFFPQDVSFQPIPDVVGGTITHIAVDPLNRNIVYITNGYEIFKSMNGGASWARLNLELPCPKDICAPSPNAIIFYSSDMGLMFSTDGGASFNPVPIAPQNMTDAVFFVDTVGSGVYLALGDGSDRIVTYRFTGTTWAPRGAFQLDSSGGAPRSLWARNDSVFVGIGGSGGILETYYKLEVWFSPKDSLNWRVFWENTGGEGSVEDIEIVRKTGLLQYMFFLTTRGIFYDYQLTPNPNGFIGVPGWSEMLIIPYGGDTVHALLARSGLLPALFYTKVYRQSLFDTSLVYDAEGITDLDFTQSVGIASTEGLGILLSNSNFHYWQESNESLFAWIAMGLYSIWSNDTAIYSVDFSGHLYRSPDAGKSWTRTTLNPLIYGVATAASPTQPQIVYAVALYMDSSGSGIVLRSTDAGDSWVGMGGISAGDISFPIYLEVDPVDFNRLWALRLNTLTGQIKASLSTNGGTDWTDIPMPDSLWSMEVAPDGRVFWGAGNGVYWGTYPDFSNRIDSLNGKKIVGLLFNQHNGKLYATDVTSGRLWAGEPGNQASWTVVYEPLPSNLYGAKGDVDRYGDMTVLTMGYNQKPTLIYTIDDGRSWKTQILPQNIMCVEMVDTATLIAGTAGSGLLRATLVPSGPMSVWVRPNPSSLRLGDTCRVVVETERWIPGIPACTLQTEGGDILPITLYAADTTGRMFDGKFWTGGLHEGQGTITATAYDKFGNSSKGKADIVIGPGTGDFMPLDSVYVYPNPAPTSDYGNHIFFRVFTTTEARVDVLLYDLEGKPAGMITENITGGLGDAVAMDISKIPSGIYIWRLRAQALNGSQKAEKMGKLAIRK